MSSVTRVSVGKQTPAALSDAQVSAVTWLAIVMNAWNRVAITTLLDLGDRPSLRPSRTIFHGASPPPDKDFGLRCWAAREPLTGGHQPCAQPPP
jgi:hypothetical protein